MAAPVTPPVEFFDNVYGNDGWFYWCSFKPNGDLAKQGWCQSVDDIVQRVLRQNGHDQDCHVGLCKYQIKGRKRKFTPVTSRHVILLDFDFKDQDQFKTPHEFYQSLVQNLPIEPTAVVATGGGVHVYYSLEDDVQEFVGDLYYNIDLYFKGTPYGLDPRAGHTLHDTSRAFDSCNYKRAKVHQLQTARYGADTYSLDQFCKAFNIARPLKPKPDKQYIPTQQDVDTNALARIHRAIDRSYPPVPTRMIVNACPAFKKFVAKSKTSYDNGSCGGYHDMRMGMNMFVNSNVKPNEPENVDTQRDYALSVMRQWPNSTDDYLTQQFDDVLHNYSGPYKCETWSAAFSDQCTNCKYNGVVHGPIQAAQRHMVDVQSGALVRKGAKPFKRRVPIGSREDHTRKTGKGRILDSNWYSKGSETCLSKKEEEL